MECSHWSCADDIAGMAVLYRLIAAAILHQRILIKTWTCTVVKPSQPAMVLWYAARLGCSAASKPIARTQKPDTSEGQSRHVQNVHQKEGNEKRFNDYSPT